MSVEKIAYEPHPVTPERKAELRAAGFKIIDAVFAPKDEEATEAGSLRDDGPTVAEYVAAGYQAVNYPPSGYGSKSTPEEIEAAIAAQAGKIVLGTASGDQFSDDELRKVITEVTGTAPHHKLGREKLIEQFNALNAEAAKAE